MRCEIVTEGSVNRAIAEDRLLTDKKGIWILKKAIRIHDAFIRITWDDPMITGDNKLHRQWNAWYVGTINLIRKSEDILITFDEAIDKLFYDSEIHQWYMDHPEYYAQHPAVGDYWHHEKWRDRWLAIVEVLKVKKGES